MEQFLMNNSIVVMKMIMIWQDFKKIYTGIYVYPSFFTRRQHNVEDPFWDALFDILKPWMILLP